MNDDIPGTIDVAVVGGSIAGLCAGTALLAAGHDVHVFERSPERLASRGAGIVVQPDLSHLLASVGAPALPVTSCTARQSVSLASSAPRLTSMPQHFTSWEAIHGALSAAFPRDRYHAGAAAEIGSATSDGVDLHVGDRTVRADVLVAADGFRSSARARFAPGTASRYAGYVAWRGVVDEADLPADLVRFFDDRFSFCETEGGGHALCYPIPGEGGACGPGERRLNWVWYVDAPAGEAFDAVMTDASGRVRRAAVPQGQVGADARSDLRRRTALLDPRFAQLVRATAEPFVQAILDVAPPAMAFGRVCLLGDAAFVVRPHTAAAAAKAAADATSLALALSAFAPDIDAALEAWNRHRMDAGRRLLDHGTMLGERNVRPRADPARTFD